MANNARILSSSRSYEFLPDRMRLSVLSLPSVIARLQETFRFGIARPGVPPAMFGPVVATAPPGVVCQLGTFADGDGAEFHLRELYVEPRRVVISVAGEARNLDFVWERLRSLLMDIGHQDAIQGDPHAIRHASEVSAQLKIPPSALVASGVMESVAPFVQDGGQVWVPAIHGVIYRPDDEYEGDFPGPGVGVKNVWVLSLRAGSAVANGHDFYSSAPLEATEHIAFLSRLATSLQR